MIIDKIRPFTDEFGLVVQTDGDGGDTAQREGMIMTAAAYYKKQNWLTVSEWLHCIERSRTVISRLVSQEGMLRRHCDSRQWYGQWNRASRDQTHIIIGIALMGFKDILVSMFKNHLRRCLLFTTNTRSNGDPGRLQLPDVTFIGFWAIWIRCFFAAGAKPSWAKPLLQIFDVSLVVNSIIRRFSSKENVDSLNHFQAILLSQLVEPTLLSRLAVRIWRGMPRKFDNELTAIEQEFAHYFRKDVNGVTAIAEIYSPIIKKTVYNQSV